MGVVGISLSAIFIRAWTIGPDQRGKSHSETSENRRFRTRASIYTGVIGVLSLGIAIFIWSL